MLVNMGYGWQEYNVDVVLCIDATADMAPIIEKVKSAALSVGPKIAEGMELVDVEVADLRVKVIAFRDYAYDEEPMVQSEFFTLPEQEEDLKRFVNSIEAKGGGDRPKNALEAIALALKSDWTTGGARCRHVIAVFSNAPALPLGERAGCPKYPSDLPKTFEELFAMWEGINESGVGSYQCRAGRLIAFVPEDESWRQLEVWNRFCPVYMAEGTFEELDWDFVLHGIVPK